MASSLDELYRDVILDHYRNPRHQGALKGPHVHAEGQNPSCGDEFSLDLAIDDGVIVDVGIQGQGCSISQASGSMMANAISGKSLDQARELRPLRWRALHPDEDAVYPMVPAGGDLHTMIRRPNETEEEVKA